MPPSWLKGLGEIAQKIPPELEHADWTRSLAMGEGSSSGLGGSTFAEGLLSTSNLALPGEVCAMATDPVTGYLAVGTANGTIHLFGSPAVQLSWTIRPALKIKHLLFKPGSSLLIVIDVKDNLSIFDLSRSDPQARAKASAETANPFRASSGTSGGGLSGPPHPDTPMRVGAYSTRNSVLCIEASPAHSHLFMGLRDGTIDTYDLERMSPSPYRVPNLWWEEEEILRKSGVPDAPNRRHVPLVIDIKTHPRDINQLLIAYEGGIILLDVKERAVLKTFQLRHLPGAAGSGVGPPEAMWTERSAPATCIAWRSDGAVFASGHEDGCIAFWNIEDDDKPLTVRTLESVDVDKVVGIPDDIPGGPPQSREPIFKLSWSGFPEQSWLDMAANATSRQQNADSQPPTKGSILTVLGGATERHSSGLVCLHFPPYAAALSLWNSKTPDAIARARQLLRDSVDTVRESRYVTDSTVEDYLLIPRGNPHYGMAYDPIAIIALLASDSKLPPLPPPSAARGLVAFAFPPEDRDRPKRESAIPLPSSPGSSIQHVPGRQLNFQQKTLNLPLALATAGSGAILGARLVEVSTNAYRKLAGKRDVTGPSHGGAGSDMAQDAAASSFHGEDLHLHGGEASPTAAGGTGDRVELDIMARAERFRVLITWHLDGTVRFHDASPQLLLLGHAKPPSNMSLSPIQQAQNPALPPDLVLQKGFPSPLPHLTISVRNLVNHRSMTGHPIFDRLRGNLSRLRVSDVAFAPDILETAIILSSGQVLHFKFGFAKFSEKDELQDIVAEEVQQDEDAAAAMVSHLVPSSPTGGLHAHRDSMRELDGAMAGAIEDLRMESHSRESSNPRSPAQYQGTGQQGGPPPRPKRDPKRMAAGNRSSVISSSSSQRFGEDLLGSPRSPQAPSPQVPASQFTGPVDEITRISHLASYSTDGFKPNIIVELARGEVTAVGVSDIGFLAVACGPALAVIDLRGPELIIREGFGDGHDARLETREAKKMVDEEGKSVISKLLFSICRTVQSPVLSPQLLVTRDNGLTSVWTFAKQMDQHWHCVRTAAVRIDELARPVSLKVLDMAGNVCTAVPAELQRSMREQTRANENPGSVPPSDYNVLLGIGFNSLVVRVGITGPRLAKADVGERIVAAGVVDRRGEKVCAVLSETSIRIFSLPHLVDLTRLQRHNKTQGERLGSAAQAAFDGSGDFVEVASSLDVRLWTIFATLPRPGPPSLLLYTPVSVPLHPGAVGAMASSVVGWLGGKSSSLTQGGQFDEMLAGPKRPPLPKLPEPRHVEVSAQKKQAAEARAAQQQHAAAPTTSASGSHDGAFQRKKDMRKEAVHDTQSAADQAAWNLDLAKQRGELMNNLEQGMSSLERGAKEWMKSAREDMVKQAAKDKISKFF
ncbi:hypothetical protein FA10DRAFT_268495 [Acaromyces ingoldii]|uniref:Lethal giant larvae (Lgl)-like C-terminal domain-containing protein n=1 Tax=Acaromyces ingoldii TaxID=215250 RepID=A0A316YKQ2_9BASI|nr:hypothetical protein FA10DRAFT_268495 [Acaromyces ingoldii]PWN88295.1 hypothetical protein FA10DRAFT_268495 [Acaromyces ingoldii]